VFEAGSTTAAVRATAEASAGDIGALTDSITLALVRELWPSGRAPSFEPHALTTRSVEALRAFLAGELATAQGRWRDAPEPFARAFALDSTFWLAGARYLDAMDYSSRPVDPAFRQAIWEHRDALPERQRALMEAGRADSLSQMVAQMRDVAERYPDSWRAWFAYADQIIHNGMFLGETQEEARTAIERAVALNPTSSTLWQHLFWMALADRDTAATRTAIEKLDALGTDSTSMAELGLDQVRLYRFLHGLAATGDEPDPMATDSLARQLVDYEGPLDLSRVGGEVLAYGFPRGETALEERTLALPVPAAARRGALRSLSHALAARGAWDSALVVMDEYVASASGAEPLLLAWRLAAIGQWLGTLSAGAGDAWRETLARGPDLDPSSRSELAWLDGVAAAARGDTEALAEARSRLAAWTASAPEDRDTVPAGHLARSLDALALGAAGRTEEAADALRELERDRAERLWFRREGNAHPYLTAVNRLSAAGWLLDAGRAGDAEALLRWYESVQFPAWRAGRADGTLRASIRLRRARVADALGREAAAREHRARALEELDLASGPLGAAVDSARAALGL
jgi:tetratricopeptide (TPR) repeat protein